MKVPGLEMEPFGTEKNMIILNVKLFKRVYPQQPR